MTRSPASLRAPAASKTKVPEVPRATAGRTVTSPGKAFLLSGSFMLAMTAWALFFSPTASAWIASEWLGGWPGVCEDSSCMDDGTPVSDPPPEIRRNIMEHQLASSICSSDLVFITLEHPENTGSDVLDARLAEASAKRFREARELALKLSCNDLTLDGCGVMCLPVGIESRYYLHKSAPWTLSAFRVDRFIGNFRGGKHQRGTVDYFFENYSLVTGAELTLPDLFPQPVKAAPLFWARADEVLAARGACPSKSYLVSGPRAGGRDLKPSDILLSRHGATLALYTGRDKKCLPQALDLSKEEMVSLGASPLLWESLPPKAPTP
jgi:hypothetical protein